MNLSGWVTGAALGCALTLAPVSAGAVVIIKNATGQPATDFHIEFSAFADLLKLVSNRMGNGQTYPPPAPPAKQKTIDFSGGAGVANGGELKIEGLRLATGAGGGLTVVKWWWTKGANVKLDGAPQINVEGTYFTLGQLADKGVNVTRAIPEPATWAMMILGFAATGAMLRRRRLAAA